MDIPMTICTVIIIQYSDGAVPAYIDGKETFIFFGEVTKSDYDMVNEYILELSEHYGANPRDVKAELKVGEHGGLDKFIHLPEGNMTSGWETR